MSNSIATVQNIEGLFFSKDSMGNITQLKLGDIITKNMLVYGDNSNDASSKISISMTDNNNLIELTANEEQLFDDSTHSDNIIDAQEGLQEESLNLAFDNNNNDDDYRDELLEQLALEEETEEPEETEAGEEEKVKGENESAVFDARDGAIVDVNSDLRDAKFNTSSHLFEIENQFLSESPNTLTSISSPAQTIESPTATAPTTSTTPTPIVTPSTPEVIPQVVPEISINNVSRNEEDGTMTFTITSSAIIGSDISFSYASADATAKDGSDFNGVNGTAIISAGQTTTTIVVPLIDDNYAEDTETFLINLSNISQNATIADGEGVGTILDAGLSTVYVKLTTDSSVHEGEDLVHGIKLVDANGNDILLQEGQSVNVTLTYTPNTLNPADSSDYTAQTSVTITGSTTGNGSATITNPTIDDMFAEGIEGYTLSIDTITDLSNTFENIVNEGSTVTGTIADENVDMESVTVKLVSTDAAGNIIPAATIPEGNTAYYKAILVDPDGNEIVGATGDVDITFTDGTAIRTGSTVTGTDDFTATDATVTLNTVFSAVAKDDYMSDSGETFNVQIIDNTYTNTAPYENVVHNTTALVTTITDNSKNTPTDPFDEHTAPPVEADLDAITVKLFAISEVDGSRVAANSVTEGDSAEYIAVAFDGNGNEILAGETIKVSFGKAGDSATADGVDYTSTTQTVTLGTNFSTPTSDDYLADNGEQFSIQLTDKTLSNASQYETVVIDTTSVTTTIIDNSKNTPTDPYDEKNTPPVESDLDTITIKLYAISEVDGSRVPANEVTEGSSAEYIAVAFDKNGNEVLTNETVEVTFGKTGDSATAGTATTGDYTATTQTVTLGTKFSTPTTDDYIADNGETYKVQITDKSLSHEANYETVVIDTSSVTTTITDNSKPNTPNNPSDGVETDMESVTVKLVSTDAAGNIIPAATIPEGDTAYYKAILVDPDGNQIVGATGDVDITFTDGTAIRTGSTATGTDDFTATDATVTLNTVFSAVAKDDYMSDSGETFNVQITDDTYTKASDYENVVHDTTAVITTITDDTDTTPNDKTDTPTETGAEQVILKIVACDASGDPIITAGKYTFTNEVAEGNDAKYMVLAFKPGTTEFTTSDKVQSQGGTVTIKTTDITNEATGVTAQTLNDGTQDYILETTKEVTVGTAFDIKTLNDFINDNNETYNVSINDGTYTHPTTPLYENVTTDTNPVTTNITDDTTPLKATIVLVAVDSATTKIADITDTDGKLIIDNTNTTPESGKLYYLAVAVDADGKPLDTQDGKVDVAYGTTTDGADKDAIAGTDYDSTTVTEATIGKVFEVLAKDDFYAEGDENFTVTISNPNNTPYENPVVDGSKDMVTSTIEDNPADVKKSTDENNTDNPTTGSYDKDDTIYVKITQAPSTIEGGNLVHTVTLVDKDGVAVKVPEGETVTVTLEYAHKSTTGTGTFVEADDLSTIVKTVTITGAVGGTSSVDFTNITKDDFTAEGDEVYTVTITDVSQSGAFENVAISTTDNTTGTIKDGVVLGNPADAGVDEDDFDMSADPAVNTITDTKLLNIVSPTGDNGYELLFDNNIVAKDPDTGNAIALTSNGQAVTFDYSTAGKIIATRADGDKVFEITLNKNAAGGSDDNYIYTQYKNIDHPDANVDDNVVLTFGYKITDQNSSESSVKNFTVTVNDSLPSGTAQTVEATEDKDKIIYISDESFKDGKITLNNGVGADQEIIKDGAIDIYDTEKDDAVGSLTNNGDGTLTFTPSADYSGSTAGFAYAVSDTDGDSATATVGITVKPVADAPTLENKTVSTWEDANTTDAAYTDGNAREGTNVKVLGLKIPVKEDQTDKNDINSTENGDNPERLGAIEFSFATSGDFGTAAIGYDADGDGVLDTKLQDITKTSEFTIDITDVTNYHVTGTTGTYSLTQAQYKSIAIMHDEDNAKNIKTKIAVASHEVQEDGSLYATDIISDKASQIVTLDVKAVTDEITPLLFTNNTDTYTYTIPANTEEGELPAIDIASLLNTQALNDNDGSENRWYTFTGLVEGSTITLGSATTLVAADGTASISFPNNKEPNPTFTIDFPEQYSGTPSDIVITLHVQDTDSDSTVTPEIRTDSVTLNITGDIAPVADPVTLQVAQAKGDEDAGRSDGNSANDGSATTINDIANAIDLQVKATSADKDGSETFTITISDIPTGATMYYDGAEVTQSPAGSIEIPSFDSTKALQVVPPHNSDADFTLNVSAKSVDGGLESSVSQALAINVQVTGVADIPVNDDLATASAIDDDNHTNTYTLVTTEDSSSIDLQTIFANSANLAEYDNDGSEALTMKVTGVDAGFDLSGATLITGTDGSRVWYVDIAELKAGHVTLERPTNFAGEMDFDVQLITTEEEGDSATHAVKNVSLFVTPVVDTATVTSTATQNEDESKVLTINFSSTDTDTASAGIESFKTFAIDVSSIDSGVTLKDSNDNVLTDSGDGFAYLSVTNGVVETITATLLEDSYMSGSYDFDYKYTYTDTATDTNGNTYSVESSALNNTYTVAVTAVTDDIDLNMSTGTTDANITDDAGHVTVSANGKFTKTLAITGIDSDGRGSLDEDGSEKFTRVTVSGVPEGISIVGGTYAGDTGGGNHSGFWYVDIADEDLDGSTSYDLVFDVDGSFSAADLATYQITVTAYNEDNKNGSEQNDSENFDLTIDTAFTGTTGTPAVIVDFYQDIDQDSTQDHTNGGMDDTDAYKESVLREDKQFTLSDVVHVEIEDTNVGANNFSITLKNVPTDVTISGMTYNSQDGGFYTLSGSGNPQAVIDALQAIHVTPASNANTDAGDISSSDLAFDIELTTYASGGASNTALINFTGSVLPLTDEMTLTVDNDRATDEDSDQAFSITLDNAADGTKTQIIDGKVYIQVSETYNDAAGSDGTTGTLNYGGSALVLEAISGVAKIADGNYYVVSGVSYNDKLDFIYTPAEDRDGSVAVKFFVKNIESESWSDYDTTELVSEKTVSFDIKSATDGYTLSSTANRTGDEDTTIALDIALSNPDSSEKLTSLSLDAVPDGFLVYYDNGNGTKLAENLGANAPSTDNLWNIPLNSDGSIPAVSIQAPKNWSGTIPTMTLKTLDAQGHESTNDLNVTVNPIVDTLTLNTTQTFGDAGDDIALNLNANIEDLDGSETVKLELTGLGEHAGFKVGGVEIDSANVSYSGDTYTLQNIAAADVNNITFVQSSMSADVSVNAYMVESDGTTSSAVAGNDFAVTISDVSPTSGDDTLLYDGSAINAGAGTDTITLKQDTNTLDFSKLDNIEKIDLSANGNHSLSGLTLDNVLDMTDGDNELIITGDADDDVAAVDTTGWSETNTTDNGSSKTYEYSNGTDSIKLTVDDQIDTTGM